MNQSGLKESDFENRRMFSKKAREPQKHYAKQCVFVFKLPNRCEKNRYASVQSSLKIIDASEKAIFTIIVSKVGQSFQISSEFKLNKGMTLSKSTRYYFKYVIDST